LLVAAIRDPGSNNIFFFLIEILIAISLLLWKVSCRYFDTKIFEKR
jgi:hypothetical protein